MPNKRKARLAILIGATSILVITLLFLVVSKAKEGEKILAETTFSDIDLSRVSNGKHLGEYEAGLVSVKVEVTVENGTIQRIDLLEHKNGKGKPAEGLIDDILNKQTTNVDVVTGATSSSIVIRKAIENALTN